jgi:hypothetical protein
MAPCGGGPTGSCQPARTRRGHRGRSRRGGVGSQGSPAALMQRGRRCEYDDGEGRSPGKKDGGVTHQGGSSADEVADGAARWRFFKGGGVVEAEGLASVRPEESLLALIWISGRRRAPVRCSLK